uniref:Putative reverse transcriptase domain-containing protein n=1 Tax=Tanacetum cinerariifolium TaxID=118510 RepID=A0A6L2LR13_TANCI|nr:putative reverse transcriptase domain-containing protein [Tanacetum cinerariifolium]
MKADEKKLKDIHIIRDFPKVFPDDLTGLPPIRPINFLIDLVPEATLVAKAPYRLAPSEMQELSTFPWTCSKQGRYSCGPEISQPHTLLTQNDKKFDWGEEQEKAFQTLKDALCSALILTLPDGPDGFVVNYHASRQCLRCVLMQKSKAIAHASQKLKEDTAYPCLHSPKTTMETCSIRRIRMDDLNITMEGYIRLEEEKARKHRKVFKWETAKYGKIWYDEDIHNLRFVKTEFLAIAFNNEVSSEKTLSCEPTISSLNNEIDFRISFDDFDDEDYTVNLDNSTNNVMILLDSWQSGLLEYNLPLSNEVPPKSKNDMPLRDKMDDPNITMEGYIRLKEEKARKLRKVFNLETTKYGKIWYHEDIHDLRFVETEFLANSFNDGVSSEKTHSCEPTIISLNNEIDFRISFDDSDDEDYTVIFNKNLFSYKIISTNDSKTNSENDNKKVNMPSLLPPEPTVSCFDDLDFFKDFGNEFPAIVYNDAQTPKSDLLIKPILSPQHIDEFDLNDETSLFEYDEDEQNALYFKDLSPLNIIHTDDLKSEKDNDDNEINIIQSSGGDFVDFRTWLGISLETAVMSTMDLDGVTCLNWSLDEVLPKSKNDMPLRDK